MKIFTLLSLFFLFTSIHLSAQAVSPLLGIQSFSEFKRELDNFNSKYGSNWDNIQQNYRFGYSAQVQSRLFLFNKKAQNIQDETTVAAWYNYNLKPNFTINTEVDYYYFTNTQVKTYQVKTGVDWTLSSLKISPTIGWYVDDRSNRKDDGLLLSVSGRTNEFDLGDNFYTTIHGSILRADLDPRLYQRWNIKNQSRYETKELQLFLNGMYSFNQRDSYQPSSFFNRDITDIIEKVLSDSSSIQFRMSTNLNEQIRFHLDVNSLYNIRDFTNTPLTENTSNTIIDTKYTRQDLAAVASIDYTFSSLQGTIGTRYTTSGLDAEITRTLNVTNEILNRRDEQLKNTFYNQDILELFGKSTAQLTDYHQLIGNATVSILRFDTPESNFDDRDELFSAFDIEHKYTQSNQFETSVLFSAEAYHRVFLFSQRSIENNWRRSIRLQPAITWYPTKSIRLLNQFLVRANYTVYDFQDREGTIRDQSSREWGLSSDLRWEFAKDWFSSWLFSRNQLIIGQLFWNEFAETPIDTLTTTRIESAVELVKGNNYFKLGIRVFIKDDYVPATVLRLNNESEVFSRFTTGNQTTLQWGPMISVRWVSPTYGEISLDGWVQLQYLKNDWYIDVPETFTNPLLFEERYTRTRVFPNLSIRTKLYL